MSGWRVKTYCSRGVDRPVFSSNRGVPPGYIVPSGSPNGFSPFAASCWSRQDPAGAVGGAGASWRHGAASSATRVAQRVIAAILPGGGRRGLARRSAGFAPALASGARRRVDRRGYRAARSPSLLRPAPRDRPDPGGSRGCRAGAGSRRPRARLAGVARRRCRGGVRPRPGRGCNRERSRRARVLARGSGMKTAVLLGAGGLGCPAALALAESQPDLRLIIVDPDRVDRSNLARQILYGDADLGAHKAEVAARRTGGAARAARVAAAA